MKNLIYFLIKKIFKFIIIYINLFKFYFYKFFNIKIIKSKYGILFASNYQDKTFKFYITGAYGKYYWNRISQKKNKFIFLDIGANQGLYSICALLNPNCLKVYSFEPVLSTFQFLKKNIKINRVKKKSILVNKAISITNSKKKIFINRKHSGISTISYKNFNNANLIDTETIKTVNAIYLNKLVNNDDKFSIVIKIDTEGHETEVIKTLSKFNLIFFVDEIFYEINENWVNHNEIKNMLKNVGFKYFTKIGKGSEYDILATKKKIS